MGNMTMMVLMVMTVMVMMDGDDEEDEAHGHKDGPCHGDGVERVEEGGEQVDVESRFETESPQLFRIGIDKN